MPQCPGGRLQFAPRRFLKVSAQPQPQPKRCSGDFTSQKSPASTANSHCQIANRAKDPHSVTHSKKMVPGLEAGALKPLGPRGECKMDGAEAAASSAPPDQPAADTSPRDEPTDAAAADSDSDSASGTRGRERERERVRAEVSESAKRMEIAATRLPREVIRKKLAAVRLTTPAPARLVRPLLGWCDGVAVGRLCVCPPPNPLPRRVCGTAGLQIGYGGAALPARPARKPFSRLGLCGAHCIYRRGKST